MSLARAIETGDLTLLPSRRDEDWRWTDIAGQVRTLPPASPQGAVSSAGPFDVLADEIITIVNGQGSRRIEIGNTRTIALRFVSVTHETAHAATVAITVAEGARLTLLESYEGMGAGYLAHAALSLDIAAGASVERIVLASDAEGAISVSEANVTLAPSASFAQTILTGGAKRQRLETRVAHPGGGADVRMDGVYLLSERRHADLTTVVEHLGRDGTTSELVKGMVSGQARAVFQGRIVVAKGADGTDARMGHHALIASERAEVDAKPELLIFADDVQCAHGNTIGALDEDALFYIRQRGVALEEARAMLTGAFVTEVVDRIVHDGARDVAAAWVASRLDAR